MSAPEESLIARSALASQPDSSGWRGEGIRISEWPAAAAVLLTLARTATNVGAAPAEFALPPDGACRSDARCTVTSCGPRRYLAVAFGEAGKSLVAEMQRQFASRAAVVDYSDQLTFIALAGPKAARVLAALCSIDFDPGVFAPGRAIVTRMRDVRAFIWREPDGGFVVGVQRSLAVTAWESLLQTCKSLLAE